jgi:hypothetical protein
LNFKLDQYPPLHQSYAFPSTPSQKSGIEANAEARREA